MSMQNNEMESIWADGVPPRINKEDIMTPSEILKVCLNYMVEDVIKNKGYNIRGITDDINTYPNLILEKDNKMIFVAVVPCVFPNYMREDNDLRFRYVEAAKKHNARPLICPVFVSSYDKERALKSIMLKGDLYRVLCRGQIELTNAEKQDLSQEHLKKLL